MMYNMFEIVSLKFRKRVIFGCYLKSVFLVNMCF